MGSDLIELRSEMSEWGDGQDLGPGDSGELMCSLRVLSPSLTIGIVDWSKLSRGVTKDKSDAELASAGG